MAGRRKNSAYMVFSVAVTVGVFWYLFSHISPWEVLSVIRGADTGGILVFVALSLLMSAFRMWRYALLLRVSGYVPGKGALFLVVLVRNFFSDLLPARMGALIYIYIITSRLGIPFGAAASSFSLSFLFDMVAIAPMILLAILWAGSGTGLSVPVLLGCGVLFALLSCAVIAVLPFLARWMARIVSRLPGVRRERKANWSKALLEMREDLLAVESAGVYGRLFALSVMVRLTKYASLYVLLLALLSPLGFGIQSLPIPRVFLGICAAEVGASLPVSGLAGFGVYEGVWSVVFELLGFSGRIAKLTSVSHHLFTQSYGYLLGIGALLALLLPLFRVRELLTPGRHSLPRPLVFYWRVVLGIALSGLLIWGGLQAGDRERRHKTPAVQGELSEQDRQKMLALDLPGRVVFDSNRRGTFGIFSMAPDGSDIRVIVDTDKEEMYPDPSPDGKTIVFARAATTHRRAPCEIWMCRADGTGERKLAENGTFPTFSGAGEKTYFERERKKVMGVDIEGGNEQEIFPAGRRDWKGYQVVKPRVSPDGQWVAFTSDRGGRWNCWCAALNGTNVFHVGRGCEPAWFPDSRRIVWVRNRGVRQKSGLFVFDTANGETREIQDDGPPWGHEYFPSVSGNGDFLLWCSCPEGQHSHISADYQIFVMSLRKMQKTRATGDTANNRWPKLIAPSGGVAVIEKSGKAGRLAGRNE